MKDSYPERVFRLIGSGLATTAGLLVLAIAIVAAWAIVAGNAAAQIIGLIALVLATSALLVLIGRRAKPGSAPQPSTPEPSTTPVQDQALQAALGRARARLIGMAQQLDLPQPAPLETSGPRPDFQPLVTVIVPVFNDEAYVEAAIESVRRQSYRNWDCVIVDDASTDSSLRLVESAVGDDRRFHVIRHDTNRGPGAARNRGIAEAVGSHLVFLDADDLLLRESLTDRVSALADRAEDQFVIGSFCAVRFSPEAVTLDELPDRRHATQPDFVDFVTAGGECPFTMIAPLVAAEPIRAIGGFDESMRSGGVDWDLWYRLLRNGYVFVPSRTLGAVYRQRGQGITRGNPAAHTAASERLIRAAYENADPGLQAHPSPYPMTDPLPAYQARLTVAERAIRFASMALVDGDREAMTASVSVLEPGTWPLLERHLDMAELVARGAARVLGVRPRHLDPLGEELAPFVAEVEAVVRSAGK